MPFPSALDAALQADGPLIFHAIEIVLPGPVAIRLLDGAGQLTLGGNTYVGVDAIYGKLDAIDAFTDGVGDQSPHLVATISPPTNAAAATLASASNQGSTVTLYFGAIDRATGLIIGSPDTMFVGEIDVGKLVASQNTRRVELDIASVWDRFFDVDEGIQLNNAWHQSIWPGELGLSMITAITYQIPWGGDGPRPNIVADGTAASGQGAAQRELQNLVRNLFL
jgi:hypothetical protein